eukprot:2919411-Amphidinium_carterae.1
MGADSVMIILINICTFWQKADPIVPAWSLSQAAARAMRYFSSHNHDHAWSTMLWCSALVMASPSHSTSKGRSRACGSLHHCHPRWTAQ